MELVFDIGSMTHLRYLVPLMRAIVDTGRQHKFIYAVDTKLRKYNATLLHQQQLIDILRKYVPDVESVILPANQRLSADVCFTIESISESITVDRWYAIPHGYDSIGGYGQKAKRLKCTSYITNGIVDDVLRQFDIPLKTTDVPVPFWYTDDMKQEIERINVLYRTSDRKSGKLITVLYPDNGYRDIADRLISRLLIDHDVVVKQRRKWQQPTCDIAADRIVYDTLWYPSDPLCLSLASDVTIGFSSSAYTDLIPYGIKYVNIDVLQDEHIHRQFVHPTGYDNYVRVTCDYIEDTLSAIRRLLNDVTVDVDNTFDHISFVDELLLYG